MLNSINIKLSIYLIGICIIFAAAYQITLELQASTSSIIFLFVFIISCCAIFLKLKKYIGIIFLFYFSFVFIGLFLIEFYKQNHWFLVDKPIILKNIKTNLIKINGGDWWRSKLKGNDVLDITTKKVSKTNWFKIEELAGHSRYKNNHVDLVYNLHMLPNRSEILRNKEQRNFIRLLLPECYKTKECFSELNQTSQDIKMTVVELKNILNEKML